MNVYVMTEAEPARVLPDIGCIELRPGHAALVRDARGQLVASIPLSPRVWLAVSQVAPDDPMAESDAAV